MSYDDPAWAEWERKAQNHYETKEKGYTTRREEQEKMKYTTPSGSRTIYITDEGFTTKEPKEETAVTETKTVPAEIVDEELEAARKKGREAQLKKKRDKAIEKAEHQGRRDEMGWISRQLDTIETANKVAEKVKQKPIAKRVAKNIGKLMGEAKYTTAQATKPKVAPPRIAAKTTTTTTKPQAQKKTKDGPAVRKGTIGKHVGGLPVKSHKSGPGRRVGGLPVRSTKTGPGHKSNKPGPAVKSGYKPVAKTTKDGPVARSGYHPGHKSTKPLAKNIPKTAVVNKQRSVHVNKQRSVNFAMRKRSKK